MNTHYTYLLVNVGAMIIPFLFSFHPKLLFSKHWKATFAAIALTAAAFIAWDVYFTHLGVWGFNQNYVSGISIFNLPLEEILFFICIPYSCLFTYHCFKVLIPPFHAVNVTYITTILVLFSWCMGIYFYGNCYTSTTFLLLGTLLIVVQWLLKSKWLNRLYLSYTILLLPFFITNGILTGTGLSEPIVWYNTNEIIGWRILTIPFEDGFYGLLLILTNVIFFEQFLSWKKTTP